jgi:hypothetical protein
VPDVGELAAQLGRVQGPGQVHQRRLGLRGQRRPAGLGELGQRGGDQLGVGRRDVPGGQRGGGVWQAGQRPGQLHLAAGRASSQPAGRAHPGAGAHRTVCGRAAAAVEALQPAQPLRFDAVGQPAQLGQAGGERGLGQALDVLGRQRGHGVTERSQRPPLVRTHV